MFVRVRVWVCTKLILLSKRYISNKNITIKINKLYILMHCISKIYTRLMLFFEHTNLHYISTIII